MSARAQQGSGGKGRYNMEKLDLEAFNAICAREATSLTWSLVVEPRERCQAVNSLAEGIQGVLMYGRGQITTRAGSLVLSSRTHKIPIRTPAKNFKRPQALNGLR